MGEIPDDLFKRLINNECSEEEVARIVAILADADQHSVYDDLILAQLTQKADLEAFPEKVRSTLNARFSAIIKEEEQPLNLSLPVKRIVPKWYRYVAVAASVTVLLSFLFVLNQKKMASRQKAAAKVLAADITPGKNDAVLTLADGKEILLSAIANGKLAEQSGIRITKTADGKIVYDLAGFKSDDPRSSLLFNTISTPRGGQYQVILPDGTNVWLNSASAIKFPMVFAATGSRKVNLTGEAYFEVTKDKKRPFVVTTPTQSVEVLGTHFDISSYTEDPTAKTTLLEGSVRITTPHQSILIKPGQQAEVSGAIVVSDVDTETAVAWKNGFFRFDDEELGSAMAKVARWYDLQVEYSDAALKQEQIAAYTTRFANVSELLKRLNQIGNIRYDLEGRTIRISRRK